LPSIQYGSTFFDADKENLFRRFFGVLLSVDALAGLIAYGAARFASGLTGASAFAATRYFSFLRFRNGLNHNFLLLIIFSCHYYIS
jgi:hypothetical protein